MSAGTLEIIRADITKVPADAIVNAANDQLRQGGGVCGAIFRAAGANELADACAQHGHCPTGSAIITPAFAITTAKYIIHAVGPIYADYTPEDASRLLRSAYRSSLSLAREHNCHSIVFPAISTGIYGYPLEAACREAIDVCAKFIALDPMAIKLVAFDEATADLLQSGLAE